MDVQQQIEPELSAWVAARQELAVAKKLAAEDSESAINEARMLQAQEAVRETVAILRAAMDARGVSREQLQDVLSKN